jgi:hypothetical protein
MAMVSSDAFIHGGDWELRESERSAERYSLSFVSMGVAPTRVTINGLDVFDLERLALLVHSALGDHQDAAGPRWEMP